MEFTNSKGIKWFLHKKLSVIGRNKITVATYFFRTTKKEDYCHEGLPDGWVVMETRSGLPIVKKI